jgi:hypothetical protein
MRNHCVAIVTWEDTAFSDEAMPLRMAKRHTTVTISTIGFVIKKGKRHTVLAGEIDNDKPVYRGITTIPNSVIKKVEYLYIRPKSKA